MTRAIATLLITTVSALADIDSGGGQTSIGSELNASSIGSPLGTGQYSLGNELNRTGLIETLYPGNFLNSGLVAYYPFNGNAEDESGNDNDGTVNGATLTTDRNGNADSAYYFNGGNDISVPDNPALSFGSGDMSVSIWYKFDGGFRPTQLIGQVEADPQGGKWLIITQGQNWLFHSQHGNNWLAPVPIVQNEDWHHLVYVKQANRYISYLDGSYVTHSESQPAIPLPDPTGNLYIGRGEGDPLRGSLDDVRIYNRGLSAEEVSELYDPEGPEPELTLEIAALTNGSVSGGGTYRPGTTATLEASPSLGYVFTGWSGDASGSDNPLAIVMDGDQTVGATFAQDTRDPDQDGLSTYQELVVHGTDPDNADSDGDGVDDDVELADQTDPNDPNDYNFLNSGLVAYYPFNGNADDESGNGNDGTVNGATLTTDRNGEAGSAYDFGGPAGEIVAPLPSGLAAAQPFTASLWVKVTSNQEDAWLISFGTGTRNRAFHISLNDTSPDSGFGYGFWEWAVTGNGSEPSYQPIINKWTHYTVIMSGPTLSAFVDGQMLGDPISISGANIDTAGHLTIGAILPNSHQAFDGSIDDIRIYDRALSDAEVSELYELERVSNYTLEIAALSNGSVSGGGTYQQGTTATLEASPSLGYLFTGWSGDASGTDNPLVIVMDGDRSVGATFAQDERDPDQDGLSNYHELVVHGTDPDNADSDGDGFDDGLEIAENSDPNGTGNYPTRVLTVTNPTNGTVTGGGAYGLGTVATLEASAALGYLFTGWSGDGSGNDNPLALVMDGNQTVGATFAQDTRDPDQDGLSNYQELVLHGTDPGNADSDGDGFNDGLEIAENSDPNAAQDYPIRVLTVSTPDNGTVTGGGTYGFLNEATLEASPALGYLFTGWSGDASGTDNPLVIVMDGNQTVGAVFGQDARDPDQDGLSNYQELVLHGTDPDNADSDGDEFIDGLEISENTDPNAAQDYPTRVLTVSTPDNGTVTGGGIYGLGRGAVLEASPAPGYVFTAWTGDASGNNNPLALVMYENQTVGAVFGQDARDPDQDGLSNYQELVVHGTDPDNADSDGDGFNDGLEISEDTNPNAAHSYPSRVLTVSNTSNGTVAGAGPYRLGTDATLEASAALGYLFAGWTGDGSGTDNPLVIVMDGDRSVGATFAQDERDPDQDGLSTYRELVLHRTDPNDPDSDGDGFNDGLEISENSDPTDPQSYPTRVLTVSTPDNGTVTGGGTYGFLNEATLEAIPDPGYVFTSWTGDGSGTDNPLTIVMDGNQTVGAIFTQEIRDPEARLVKVTFNEDLTAANLFLEWLTPGELYHVTGSVDGEEFFHFHDSEFTADARDLEVVQPVDVAFRRKLLLRVMEGPIPQDP